VISQEINQPAVYSSIWETTRWNIGYLPVMQGKTFPDIFQKKTPGRNFGSSLDD
jgi:hypothetical protein